MEKPRLIWMPRSKWKHVAMQGLNGPDHWECSRSTDGLMHGRGNTPQEAYADWLRKVQGTQRHA